MLFYECYSIDKKKRAQIAMGRATQEEIINLTQMSVCNWWSGPCPDFQSSIVDQDGHFIIHRQNGDNQRCRHTRFHSTARHQGHLVLHGVCPVVEILQQWRLKLKHHIESYHIMAYRIVSYRIVSHFISESKETFGMAWLYKIWRDFFSFKFWQEMLKSDDLVYFFLELLTFLSVFKLNGRGIIKCRRCCIRILKKPNNTFKKPGYLKILAKTIIHKKYRQ